MNDINEKIKRLGQEFKVISEGFKKEEIMLKVKELEAKTTDPEFWKDTEAAKNIMQNLGDFKRELDEFSKLDESVNSLIKFVDLEYSGSDLELEYEKVNKNFERFKIKSYLSGEYDIKNVIVTIHAGQGGTEAMDWVSMLYRMYLRFCERSGWKTEVYEISSGDEAGYKRISFKVIGLYAYGHLGMKPGLTD